MSHLIEGPPLEETHYVLLIHGTFAAPAPDKVNWYQEGEASVSTFGQRLNEHLDRAGIGPAALRRCAGVTTEFAWSGDNTHEARLQGGEKLFEKIDQLVRADPTARIHLVAHSHGGNVALRAIELYLESIVAKISQLRRAIDVPLLIRSGAEPAVRDALQSVFGPTGSILVGRPEFRNWSNELDASRTRFTNRRQTAGRWRDPASTLVPPIPELKQRWQGVGWRIFRRVARLWWTVQKRELGLTKLPRQQRFSRVRYRNDRSNNPFLDLLGSVIALLLSIRRGWAQKPFLPRPTAGTARLTFDRALNRLGRVVFLGTPFYEKSYGPQISRTLSRIWWLFDIPLITALFAFLYYLFGLFTWAVLWFCFQWASFPKPQPNPFHWYLWVQILLGLFCAVIGFALAEVQFPSAKNMYFNMDKLKDLKLAEPENAYQRIEALSVSAGMLDEVFMAMSSEPLLYGFLSPTIAEWLGGVPSVRMARLPDRIQNVSHRIFRAAMSLLGQVLTYLPRVVIFLFRQNLMRRIDDRLLGLLTSAGFGIPLIEFDKARIRVLNKPDNVPCLVTQTWDVSREAALISFVGSNKTAIAATAARYAFLWDRESLVTRRNQSRLWNKLAPHISTIQKRYGSMTESLDELTDQWARVSLTIEARLREAVGAIDLAHSSYYSSPTMLKSIADFITTGQVRAGTADSEHVDQS